MKKMSSDFLAVISRLLEVIRETLKGFCYVTLQSLHVSISHQYFLPFHMKRCWAISENVSKRKFLVSGSWWSRHYDLKLLYPSSGNSAKAFKRECRCSVSYTLLLSEWLEYNFPLLFSSSVVEKVKNWVYFFLRGIKVDIQFKKKNWAD